MAKEGKESWKNTAAISVASILGKSKCESRDRFPFISWWSLGSLLGLDEAHRQSQDCRLRRQAQHELVLVDLSLSWPHQPFFSS